MAAATLEGINFNLTEEHLTVKEAAREFAQTELLPTAIERDTHSKFPTEQVKKNGRVGLFRNDGIA